MEVALMPRFAQQTKLVAASGKRSELVAKFIDAAEMQRGNPACEVMLVSVAPDAREVVYITEVWSSAEGWEKATQSDEIQAWAASLPALVTGAPETMSLEVVGGKGLSYETSDVAMVRGIK
jgi:quinol monooxygenase YgiN